MISLSSPSSASISNSFSSATNVASQSSTSTLTSSSSSSSSRTITLVSESSKRISNDVLSKIFTVSEMISDDLLWEIFTLLDRAPQISCVSRSWRVINEKFKEYELYHEVGKSANPILQHMCRQVERSHKKSFEKRCQDLNYHRLSCIRTTARTRKIDFTKKLEHIQDLFIEDFGALSLDDRKEEANVSSSTHLSKITFEKVLKVMQDQALMELFSVLKREIKDQIADLNISLRDLVMRLEAAAEQQLNTMPLLEEMSELMSTITGLMRLSRLLNDGELKTLDNLSPLEAARSIHDWMLKHESCLAAVTQLDLEANELKILSEQIVYFRNLTSLNVSTNGLRILPETIGVLRLEKIDISNNSFGEIPTSLMNCRSLRFLNVSETGLRKIPDWLNVLTNLTTLIGHSNELTRFPSSMPSSLTEVDLSENEITMIESSTIVNHTALRSLKLNYNQLTTLPVDLSSWSHLTSLSLRHNKCSHFPVGVLTIPRLQMLDLSINRLTTLSLAFRDPAQIRELRLGENSDLGAAFVNADLRPLVNLQVLDCHRIGLTTIPASISTVTTLEGIDISRNRVELLPSFLTRLTRLQVANFIANPFVVHLMNVEPLHPVAADVITETRNTWNALRAARPTAELSIIDNIDDDVDGEGDGIEGDEVEFEGDRMESEGDGIEYEGDNEE